MYSHIGSSFGMFLAPPVLDLSCIRTLDLHLACFLQLLCWILVLFVHWIFILHVSCTSCVGSYLYSHIGSSFGMFLAPPVLDLSCIRTLDLRLLCFCSHFVDQAIDRIAGLYRCATFSSSSETSRPNEAQHILLAFIFVV